MGFPTPRALLSIIPPLLAACHVPDGPDSTSSHGKAACIGEEGGCGGDRPTIRIRDLEGREFSLPYEERDGFAVVGGDILLARLPDSSSPALGKVSGLGLTHALARWPGNVIPYSVNAPGYEYQIGLAITYSNQYYPVKLVPRTGQADYVEFVASDRCETTAGKLGGRQELRLGPNCASMGTVIHEISHVIGLLHEHQRPDRDSHVRYHPENLADPSHGSQFAIFVGDVGTYGTYYDLGSITHYDAWQGAKSNQDFVLTLAHDASQPVRSNRFRPSFKDVRTVGLMYGASLKYPVRQYRLRDFDGSGQDDVAFFDPDAGNVKVFLNGKNEEPRVWISGWGHENGEFRTGNFNRDGRTDLLFIEPGNNSIHVALNDGSRFVPAGAWIQGNWGSVNWGGQYHVGDFNGDYLDDLLFIEPGDNSVHVAFSNGSGFVGQGAWIGSNGFGTLLSGKYRVGKFNGDNRTDLLYWEPGDNSYHVAVSTGSGFQVSRWVEPGNWIDLHPGVDLLVGEIDYHQEDGREDLLAYVPHCRCMFVNYSEGGSFLKSVNLLPVIYSDQFGHGDGHYFVGNMNVNDRWEDIVFYEPGNNTLYWGFSVGAKFQDFKVLKAGFGHNRGIFF
jgi:hypothetical protein